LESKRKGTNSSGMILKKTTREKKSLSPKKRKRLFKGWGYRQKILFGHQKKRRRGQRPPHMKQTFGERERKDIQLQTLVLGGKKIQKRKIPKGGNRKEKTQQRRELGNTQKRPRLDGREFSHTFTQGGGPRALRKTSALIRGGKMSLERCEMAKPRNPQ